MCGIAGIFSFDGKKLQHSDLKVMTDILRHRGPDGEGQWLNDEGNVGLGHRRLAIIDTSIDAAQPMHFSERYVITLNGEIYNYIELKQVLVSKGYRFITQSDTEVLLAAYQEYGEECLQYLDGMFAFALYDKKEKLLFCARDRFGEKPFFYVYTPGNEFVFASEIKAIFAHGYPRNHDDKMIFRYLAYDLVENPLRPGQTFFEGVNRLQPGHKLTVRNDGSVFVSRYWSLPEQTTEPVLSFDQAASRFRELFFESVMRRLRSDVPVGTSLSGGIDSSAVVTTINRLLEGKGKIQKTFSARFNDPAKDEGKFIRIISENVKVNSFETWVDEENLIDDFEKMTWYQEEPVGGASSIAQWEVMKLAARNDVTVLLDGQGADEILGGYLHYFRPYLAELYQKDKSLYLSERAAMLRNHPQLAPDSSFSPRKSEYNNLKKYLGKIRRQFSYPPYLSDLNKEFAHPFKTMEPPFRLFDSLNEALQYSTMVYGLGKLLRLADRNSMAFSRETRLPFLYHPLVEFVFSLPAEYKLNQGWTKLLLRKAFENELPAEITWRVDKLGFQPPQEKWLKNPLIRSKINDAIADLKDRRILSKPDPAKDWSYLMMYQFLNIK